MAKKRREPFADDGRTVADMSGVSEGRPRMIVPRGRKAPPRPEENDATPPQAAEFLTREEKRAVTFAAIRAALLVALIFIGGAALFILFCVHVWFR